MRLFIIEVSFHSSDVQILRGALNVHVPCIPIPAHGNALWTPMTPNAQFGVTEPGGINRIINPIFVLDTFSIHDLLLFPTALPEVHDFRNEKAFLVIEKLVQRVVARYSYSFLWISLACLI